MKKSLSPIALGAALGAFAFIGCSSESVNPIVKWETIATGDKARPVERFTISNTDSVAKICFLQLPRKMKAVSEGDTIEEINAGYYALKSNKFGTGEPAVIDIELEYAVKSLSEVPSIAHAVTPGGRVIEVDFITQDPLDGMESDEFWRAWTITADSIYNLNEKLSKGKKPGPFDVVPSFKKVTIGSGTFKKGLPVETRIVKHDNPEYYHIILGMDGAVIEAATERGLKIAQRMLDNKLLAPNGDEIPCAEIEDWPDFGYRAVMIDISRNYMNPDQMKKLTRLMADYRFNTLHFHLIDDEGWRLEIDGLPELTEIGARRGYTLDETHFLTQTYFGDANPDSKTTTANGYFTREDFVDFLRHCDSLGISVIPEVETPGHARAAIKAMEARYRNTGDNTYRLILPGDTSIYETAQGYYDNLMNPAAPGTYRFISKVADEIVAMYQEAGVDLPGIHLGGDEVPEGAWDGSPEAMAMAKEAGVNGRHGLQGEFVRKVVKMMADKGLKIYGWHDICLGYDDEYNREVAPVVAGVNSWTLSSNPEKNLANEALSNGFDVILSSAPYYYLDMLYAPHPNERGLYWAAIVDELRTLNGYPDKLCPSQPDAKGKVIGVSGQLFGETVWSPEMAESLLFPKITGLAERGWNKDFTYSDEDFNMLIGEKELPELINKGVAAHMRMPGIKEIGGKILMNSPYPDAKIYYTTDGSNPTEKSALYEAPIEIAEHVRAVLVKNGRHSAVVSYSSTSNADQETAE